MRRNRFLYQWRDNWDLVRGRGLHGRLPWRSGPWRELRHLRRNRFLYRFRRGGSPWLRGGLHGHWPLGRRLWCWWRRYGRRHPRRRRGCRDFPRHRRIDLATGLLGRPRRVRGFPSLSLAFTGASFPLGHQLSSGISAIHNRSAFASHTNNIHGKGRISLTVRGAAIGPAADISGDAPGNIPVNARNQGARQAAGDT